MSTYVANTDGDKTNSGYKTKSPNMSKNEAGSSLNMSVQWSERIYEKQKRPTLRNSHNVCSDSKHKNMYLFGGRSKGGSNNHLYSLSNDSLEKGWELIECNGTIPAPRKSATLVYCAGYLYLFGGNYKEQLLADFYAFRIDKKNWMQIKAKGTAPQARDRHTMCVLDNKIYVFGGHTQDSEFCNDLYMYDPKINTWSEIKASMSPTARYEHVCVSIGNLLVVAGGKCKKGGLADIWSFDTKSNNPKWIQPIIKSTNKRDPRWGQSCVTFNKYILLFGGWN